MSVANDVFSDGNIEGSGWKPETDEMTDVDVKARFQMGTTGNSSNRILKISDSDIARGVFYVFFLCFPCSYIYLSNLNSTHYESELETDLEEGDRHHHHHPHRAHHQYHYD